MCRLGRLRISCNKRKINHMSIGKVISRPHIWLRVLGLTLSWPVVKTLLQTWLCVYKLMSCTTFIIYCINWKAVCLHFWHADNSAVFASIETGLARNESCVFKEHKVYFYKPTEPTVHRQECVKGIGVSSH